MTTRGTAILVNLELGFCLAALGFASGDFWNNKQPSQWNDKEIHRLLTKSPWAKEVIPEMDFSGMGNPGGGRGEMGGGTPGGRGPGMGGPGMGAPGIGGPAMDGSGQPGGAGGPSQMKTVVRWESAAPIREATRGQLPSEAAGTYVVSVSGLPPTGGLGRRPASPDQSASGGADPSREMLDRVRSVTVLQRKGKDALTPIRVSQSVAEGTILFYFSSSVDPISLDDKEVVFRTQLGPMKIKVTFFPAEMQYHTNLAL